MDPVDMNAYLTGEVLMAAMPEGFTEIGTNEQLAALYIALTRAQAAFGAIHRNQNVKAGSYSFNYAPLDQLVEATRSALAANGLVVLTPVVRTATGCKALVIVAHSDGARICSEFRFEPTGTMKDIGGQQTYARRYGYSAMLNLTADDDLDDQAEVKPQSRQQPKPPQTARETAAGPRSEAVPPVTPNGATTVHKPTDEQLAQHARGIKAIREADKDPVEWELTGDESDATVVQHINAMARVLTGKAAVTV